MRAQPYIRADRLEGGTAQNEGGDSPFRSSRRQPERNDRKES